ncbi:caax amino protease family protein [Streptococcus pneumoniae]|nr:caax amino protease family protein [Streptococcus pneumoniae]
MKKRAIQILLALSLIFYKSTWFWRLFNYLAKPYLPASREFFQILLLLAGKWCSFVSSHLSTSFCRKEDFSFQVAVEVLYLPFTGLHHFVYV